MNRLWNRLGRLTKVLSLAALLMPAAAYADDTVRVYFGTSTGKESVTVAAGTYANATKYVYTFSSPQAGETTAEQWVDDKVGLVKMVSTTNPPVPAGVPAGFDLKATTTMELQSVTP